MNMENIRLEKHLRTLRSRMEMEIGIENIETCKAYYLVDTAVETVECSTTAEVSDDLGLSNPLPKRDWCRKCNGACKRPR